MSGIFSSWKNVYWKVLNSKDYGIPQSRARVWFVCIRKDIKQDFSFPEPVELKIFIKDILEQDVEDKYYLSEKMQERFKEYLDKKLQVDNLQPRNGKGQGGKGIISKNDGTTYCVDTGNCQGINVPMVLGYTNKTGEHQSGTVVDKEGIAPTLYAQQYKAPLKIVQCQLRRLTPKECFRLMGFLNDEINLEGLSDTQKYKLAGNGQDLNMVTLIFKQMLK